MDKKRLYLIFYKILAILLIGALILYLNSSPDETKESPPNTTESSTSANFDRSTELDTTGRIDTTTSNNENDATQSPENEVESTTNGFELGSTTNGRELGSSTSGYEDGTTTSEEVDLEKDELLLEGSKKLNLWINLGQFHHKTEFYFFNVTNPEEAAKGIWENGEKIIFKEIGPIEVDQRLVYDVESWDDDLEHVNLRIKKIYSVSSQQDLDITTVNFPLINVYKLVKDAEGISEGHKRHILLRILPKYRKLFIRKTSNELLFKGYEDRSIFKLLDEIEKVVYTRFAIKIKLTLPPSILKDGLFSLMANRNGTDYGLLKVATGKGNRAKLGHLAEINEKANVSCWEQPCSRIAGSPDGIIHPPMSDLPENLTIFSFELNRTIEFDYQEDTNFYDRELNLVVPARRFVLSKNAFRSGYYYKENKCFSGSNQEYRDHSGLFFNAHCNSGVQFVFSHPHFYHSDYVYKYRMDGLHPNGTRHESFILLCKERSELILSKKNLQVNLDTSTLWGGGINREIIPLFWFSEFSRDTSIVSP